MRKKLRVKMVTYNNFNKMHGEQNLKYSNNVSIVECQLSRIANVECQAELQYLGRNLSY